MNNTHHNEIPELSEAELLEMVDGGKITHGYDELFSHIEKSKESMVPSEAFMQKLVATLPANAARVTSGELSEVKSPYTDSTGRFAWFSAATLSSWKVATPIAVIVLMFGVMIGRQPKDEGQDSMPMAVSATQVEVQSAPFAPGTSGAVAANTHAPVAQARMMMAAKKAPAPSSAEDVIALLSSEADADASTTTSNSDISLLSIDPSSVNDLNQTYDVATN